jgi:pyruvate ferredoxin oxidoreductase alpha subunit
MKIRKQLADAIINSAKIMKRVHNDFAKKFKRAYGNGLIEEYRNDKKISLVAMGSVCGTIKDVIDSNGNFDLLRIRCFRPFPRDDVISALKNKKLVIVIDKDISLGNAGVLFTEIRDALYTLNKKPKVVGYIAGLGGVDIKAEDIETMVDKAKTKKDGEVEWLI